MAEFKKISELEKAESITSTDLFIIETLTGTKAVTRATLRKETETITPADIGLGNVNNTSDLDKPVSNATQEALDLKANITDVADTYLSKTNASSIYETKNNASGTYLSKVDALEYYVTKERMTTDEYDALETENKTLLGSINEVNAELTSVQTNYATKENVANTYSTKEELTEVVNNVASTYTTKEEFNTALSDIETLLQGV